MVGKFAGTRQRVEGEPLRRGHICPGSCVDWCGHFTAVVEDQVPGAVGERLDVEEREVRRWVEPDLVAENPHGGGRRMLRVLEVVVRQEPTALSVVLPHICVLDEEHVLPSEQRHVGDQLHDSRA